MPEVLEALLAIQDKWEQSNALMKLVPRYVGYFSLDSLSGKLDLFSSGLSNSVKQFLAQREKKYLDISPLELFQVVQAIQDEPEQVEALRFLSIHSPDAHLIALETVGKIQNKKLWETVLRNLITNIPVDLLPEVLLTVLQMREKEYQDQILRLSFEIYSKALKSTIQNKSIHCGLILIKLIFKLSHVLKVYLKRIFSLFQIQIYRNKAFLKESFLVLVLAGLVFCLALLPSILIGAAVLIYYVVRSINVLKNSLFHKLKKLALLLIHFIPESCLNNYLRNLYLSIKDRSK